MKIVRNICPRFLSDNSGNVSIVFAGVMTMLLIGVGTAIDYSSMVSKRSEMQGVADAVVLAAVTSGYQTEGELKQFSNEYLVELGYPDTSLTVELTSENTLIVSPTQEHQMFIMGAFGHDNSNISAISEAPLAGQAKANLALVLDTTESMRGQRMTALKSATAALLEELEKSNEGGEENVQVSLVPFADYVRISETNEGQNWLELQPDQEVTWKVLDEENSVNCRQVGEGELRSTECDEYVYEERTEYVEWEGCMASRPNGHHKTPDFFAGNRLQGFVAHGHCNAEYSALEPLTPDLGALNVSVQALNTRGSTYIPAGLIWGWRTLDERAPFTHNLSPANESTQNVILLMTDGSNTVSLTGTKPDFDGIYHWGESDNPDRTKEEADMLSSELCTAIKQDGIRIVSVAFEVEDESTKSLLRNCATASSDFYDATNSGRLKQAFKEIGSGLNEIRLMR